MKVIFSGLESSGKSLKLAMVAADIAHRNGKWYSQQNDYFVKYGPDAFKAKYKKDAPSARPMASNMKFSPEFEAHLTTLGIKIIYWSNIDELIKLDNVDVFIDEVANYFDARLWTDLSLDARRWLTQGAKTGVEIYGSAQDFAQVDKSFRRLVNHLHHIRKLIGSARPSPTKPPVQNIWGVCMVNELDPRTYKEEESKFASSGIDFSFFFIERKYCEIFDTNQKIIRSKPSSLRHIERDCELDNCLFHKTLHV